MKFLFAVAVIIFIFYIVGKSEKGKKQPAARRLPARPSAPELTFTISRSTQSDDDAWEGSFWEVEQPFPVEATLQIKYQDGDGKRTTRIIDVRQFGNAGYGGILIARCRLRNATRTFRIDRINECVDVETGEIIENVSVYLRDKYERSPDYKLNALLSEEYDTIRVLFYVGKADGQLRAAEISIICNTCRGLANESNISDSMIRSMYAEWSVPSIHAFKLAVGRLASRNPEHRSIVMKAAQNMVATQKTVHPAEKEALEYMEKKFSLTQAA